MPAIKIGHVVSFSSEDSSFPAENLLVGDTYKKWKCKTPGEASASVILQLDKASVINSIDIGNELSAFVEVSVGRSGAATSEFQTLVVGSSFMSPLESKQGNPGQRVRIFGPDNLTKPACFEKWDRIKVTCTQPFNKNVQFGLSFITLHAPEQISEETVGNLGRFALRDEDEEVIPVGSLFAKRKEKVETTLKGAASVRDASLPAAAARNHTDSPKPTQKVKTSIESTNSTASSSRDPHSKGVEKRVRPANNKHSPKEKPKQKVADTKESSKEKAKNDTKPVKRSTADTPPGPSKRTKRNDQKQRKPFNKLLDGVVFVLSGYVNPARQIIRDKAMDMGAKYKPDWCAGCTHLICAFPNTPKFQQVRGKGHIVSKQWIEDCHSDRKRLPWRRYALDRKDQGKDESEEEISEEIPTHTLVPKTNNNDDDDFGQVTSYHRADDSGSDTEDEIERVKMISLQEAEAKKKLDTEMATTPKAAPKRHAEEDEYGGDTDEDGDEDKRPDTSDLPMPFLPDFFQGKKFYLHNELDSELKTQLNRYIIAFKGIVSTGALSSHINYLLATQDDDIKEILQEHRDIVAVTPEWVWACNDSKQFLPTAPYEIKQ